MWVLGNSSTGLVLRHGKFVKIEKGTNRFFLFLIRRFIFRAIIYSYLLFFLCFLTRVPPPSFCFFFYGFGLDKIYIIKKGMELVEVVEFLEKEEIVLGLMLMSCL